MSFGQQGPIKKGEYRTTQARTESSIQVSSRSLFAFDVSQAILDIPNPLKSSQLSQSLAKQAEAGCAPLPQVCVAMDQLVGNRFYATEFCAIMFS